jgi:hypothetical protein
MGLSRDVAAEGVFRAEITEGLRAQLGRLIEFENQGDPPGSASVWRFAPREDNPLTKWATGLTAVTGCGFGPDGEFYATEFSTLGLDNAAPNTGEVVRVPSHSTSPATVADGLSFPGGFASGSDGSLYVSNWSIAPATTGMGAVVRIVP